MSRLEHYKRHFKRKKGELAYEKRRIMREKAREAAHEREKLAHAREETIHAAHAREKIHTAHAHGRGGALGKIILVIIIAAILWILLRR